MTTYLIRHASAGKRSDSTDDAVRPLDQRGHEQAQAIADHLSGESIERIFSSPALRCQQTVGSLAAGAGLAVEVVDWLAEGSSERSVIRKLAKFGRRNVVMCSHGDVIPEVIRALEATGMEVRGARGWKKGALWVIQMRKGTARSAEYRMLPPSLRG